MDDEVWKYMSWTLQYSVSTLGQVRNDETGYIVKHEYLGGKTRATVRMRIHGKQKHYGLATLVATEFIPNPENHRSARRIDRTKDDYSVYNLIWGNSLGRFHGSKDRSKRRTPTKSQMPGKQIRCLDNGRVYTSALEAAKDLFGAEKARAAACGIRNVCRGIQKTAHGHRFELVES